MLHLIDRRDRLAGKMPTIGILTFMSMKNSILGLSES